MKLHFLPLDISSKELIQRYTLMGSRRNCDLSFSNLFSWRFLYDTEYAVMGDFLLFRFYNRRHLAYMQPVYALPGGNDFCGKEKEDIWSELPLQVWQPVVEALIQDAQEQNVPFLFLGVSEGLKMQLEKYYPYRFHVSANRAYSDYIYERETLETLKGKKLQSKRNHVNRFLREYPSYEYKPLTTDLLPDCMRLLQQWEENNESVDRISIEAELRSIRIAFKHMERLDVVGGTLFVDGHLIAFTYGAAINYDTFDVCVEKADEHYDGAYTMINREFVAHLPAQYKYINREEDLGVPGLRNAKLSYQPFCILPKYVIRDSYTILRRKEDTRCLWKLCFGDSDEFINLYFRRKYSEECNKTMEVDGRVVAALQALPYQFNYGGVSVGLGYISGACTHPDYRNRHLMSNLLDKSHIYMYRRGDVFAALIPAEAWLYNYYARFGYARMFYKHYRLVDTRCLPQKQPDACVCYAWKKDIPVEEWNLIADTVIREMNKRPFAVLHDEQDLEVVREDLFLSGGMIIVAKRDSAIIGVAFGKEENCLWIMDDYIWMGSASEWNCFLQQMARFTSCFMLKEPIAGENEQLGQLRVINVQKALALYAARHPNFTAVIQVTDDRVILENGVSYRIENGKCTVLKGGKSASFEVEDIKRMTLNQLSSFLFAGVSPTLSLMLN